jgi:hypothetical protein
MNLFNRIILTLLVLLVMTGAIALIVVSWAIPDESIDWLADAAVWLDEHNSTGTKALITVGAACVAVIAFMLLLLELLPGSSNEVKVTGLQVGDAVLTTAAIGQRIEEAVTQVPHVSDVRATVRTKRKGVVVALDLHVDPDANLAAVTDEACEAARDVLANKVHVGLLEPVRARLHYRELRLRGRPTRRGPAPAQDGAASAQAAGPAEAEASAPGEAPQTEAAGEEEEKPTPV